MGKDTNMELVGMLRSWLIGPDFDAIAEDIAAQRRSEVWQRIQHRVGHMALAEARGYVRVKATHLVNQAVDQRISTEGTLHSDSARHLQQLTVDAVLRQAVIDIMHARQAAERETIQREAVGTYRRAA